MRVWRTIQPLNNADTSRGKRRRRNGGRARAAARRELVLERFEDRLLLAGPQLISIVPNDGDVLLAGQTRHTAPQEITFRFNEGQVIDPATLAGIQIVRAGADRALGTSDDLHVIPGFRGIGDRPGEVVFRFAETLPDDLYRITIQSSGPNALLNIPEVADPPIPPEPFDPLGPVQVPLDFRLDLAPQVLAVVPQPITRNSSGALQQAANQIDVYFNDDDLRPLAIAPSNLDPNLFQLIFTNDTLTTTDDQRHVPDSVSYDPATDKAVLTFAAPLDALGTGTFRLRIGNDDLPLPAPSTTVVVGDPGSTFGDPSTLPFDPGAFDAGHLNANSQQIFKAAIEAQPINAGLLFPGGINEPGHRDIPVEAHLSGQDGSQGVISTVFYNFQDVYGTDPNGGILHNVITEVQKQRTREIFELYGYYLGVQFVESANSGITVVTGDIRAVAPSAPPTAVAGIAGGGRAIVNAFFDWGESEYGGGWFETAMHEIGHVLGLGHSFELPPITIQGDPIQGHPNLAAGTTPEQAYPGDHDIVHGQHLFRRDSKDIDVYKFVVTSSGTFSAETIAERQAPSGSLLDTLLTLYSEVNVIRMPRTGDGPVGGAIVEGHRFTVDDGIAPAIAFEFDSDGSVFETATLKRIAFSAADTAHDVAKSIADAVNAAAAASGVKVSASVQLDRVILSGPIGVTPTGSQGQLSYAIDREVISRNDDYFSKDSFIELELSPGRYYVAVTSTGNSHFDPNVPDSGFGGTTQGAYDLRLGFRPTPTNNLTDRTNTPLNIGGDDFTVLDGDADGVPGGVHNFWFRVGDTLFVDKQPPASPVGPLGSLGNPYRTIEAALAAASSGDIVRVVGNGGGDGRLDTPSDAVAYQIGFDQFNNVLPDGSKLEVPRGVTLMVDAGAVIKLRQAVIDVGSSAQGIDRGQGALQVLGAPVRAGSPGNVVFTSFHDNELGGITDFPGNDLDPSRGDWGGLVFRDDSDREDQGIFLNYVNQARIRFGGGQVSVDGVVQVYNPVHMDTARPTVTYNTITESADAAMSANPNSFEDTKFRGSSFTLDYDRVGPHIRGNLLAVRLPQVITAVPGSFLSDGNTFVVNNTVFEFDDADPADNALGVAPGNVAVTFFSSDSASQIASKMAAAINGAGIGVTATASASRVSLVNAFSASVSAPLSLSAPVLDNSVNGLFIRIDTLAGQPLDTLEVAARFDDSDIVHGLSENLVIRGTPGGAILVSGVVTTRLDARLDIDPGIIVKLVGSRIEVEMGGTLIAEGEAGNEVLFTSLHDDRYGAGGTFDTGGDNQNTMPPPAAPAPGNWGGLYFAPTSRGSFDHAVLTFAGGSTTIEGGFDRFNTFEIRQADVRIANSVLESNDDGLAGGNRNGRLGNDEATIFVLGAQPVLVNNVFRNNQGAAISINVNALRSDFVPDWGRSRGIIDTFDQFNDNRGPLVRLNRIGNISGNAAINAMLVRGGTLNVESVWDDADIVHVLLNEVAVPNFHTFGGLRLQSSPTQSLVVKLRGDDAGFTATGTPLDINDRIGGSVQIVGSPGRPVVLTSIADDSVGAGLTPDGQPQDDTNNDGDSDVPGDSAPVFPPSGGELTVTTTTDAMTLVNGMLLRPLASGVTINSATYTGGTIAAGTYINGDGVPLEILQVGTIITTGDANLPTSNTSTGFTGIMGTAGDADLDALIAGTGFTTEEAAILTITFTVDPASGLKSGRFNFQFGSDEFSEFVGSPFNDVLGGFINGGPLTNFMRDSQGNLVSINSAFFDLDNETAPFLDIEYDGMTSGLLAQFPVQPGLNTLKIAIADVSDAVLDSGILMTDLRFSQQEVGTGGVGRAAPESGTWRSVRLDKYSNDRNVGLVNEVEASYTGGLGTNDSPAAAQALGELAPDEKSGDDNRRLGFEVHGLISLNDPGDVDVYSFKARAGTEVWFDIDRTSHALDTVLELVDANGNVLARSNDSVNETAASLAALLPGNLARVMQRDVYLNDVYGSADVRDFYSTNPRDAGMRVVLPGPLNNVPNTYYVRVRSNSSNLSVLAGGQSQGAYQLQVRLRELDEVPGSTVRYADIRFATNGIEVLGMPAHSPLLAESAETTAGHGTLGTAQDLGNLLTSDRNTLGVGGVLGSAAQVDWYSFTVDYDLIQAVGGFNAAAKTWSTIFDIDYADGLSRANTVISVFDQNGNLILVSRDSNIADDQPGPNAGSDLDDLTRGSVGQLDPYIGSVQLPEGTARTYFVAVHSNLTLPTALNATFQTGASQALVRLEPITGVDRVAETHVDFNDGQTATASTPLLNTNSIATLNAHATAFTLSDVTLFVMQSGVTGRLFTVDPFTGRLETNIADPADTNFGFGDIVMRNDGRLFTITVGNNDANSGSYREINTGDGSVTIFSDDGIVTNQFDNAVPPAVVALNAGIQFQAYAFLENEIDRRLIAIGRYPGGNGVPATNVLFELDPETGAAFPDSDPNAQKIPTDPRGVNLAGATITGLASVGGTLFAVNNSGDLFQVSVGPRIGLNPVGAALTQITNFGVPFTGLTAGPRNVENGRFINTLFATAADGRMYAFNTSGQLQAIFDSNADGIADASSIALGVGGVVGLQFSTLDYNLWHVTDRRELDAGHGINQAFDNSRNRFSDQQLQGGTSFYFGFEDPRVQQTITTQPGARNYLSNQGVYNSYDFPGGAYGSLTTNTFDLADYARADKPTVYFNYFLNTQNANSRTDEMRDSARVFISNDGVTWHMLATNNSPLATGPFVQDAELPQYISASSNTGSGDARQRVQELFDNTGGWRQARVDLGDFAGQSNLRLRFDFSTAADISDPSSPGDYRIVMPGDGFGNFSGDDRSRERGQNNRFEGFYVDDIIVGFAERGEMVTGATVDSSFFTVPQNPSPGAPVEILTGSYQLEIRRGTEYGANFSGVSQDIFLFQAFDTNDRMNQSFKLIAPAGSQVANGQTFRISDGLRTVTFEFRSIGSPAPGNVAINFTAADSPAVLAGKIRTAINNINNPAVLDVRAAVLATSNRIDLANAADVTNGSMAAGVFSAFRLQYDLLGDENLHRDQGQIVIESNRITNSLEFAIRVDSASRDANGNQPHPGGVRNLSVLNSQRLVPGIMIENNVLALGGTGGILFSGDPNPAGTPLAAVPFGRIVNNTIFGSAQNTGVGIRVTESSSPTILNNIFAGLARGIEIDASSGSTVVGGSLYRLNDPAQNKVGGGPETFAISLAATDALFRDADSGNFYLAAGSRAIDSSVDNLPDRPALTVVQSPLGIPVSPIIAPELDVVGQLRVDDPTVAPPPGIGGTVFKDRGALERADFAGPVAVLVNPRDNDLLDQNPSPNVVHRLGESIATFAVQLVDSIGSGIDDLTVLGSRFVVRRNGVLLRPGVEYTFSYDRTSDLALFTSASGVWLNGNQYTISLDNGVKFDQLDPSNTPLGIRDLAGNLLRANAPNGFTEFNILLDSVGNDAPVIHVESPQSVNEDAVLTFSPATGNLITIFDVDAGANPIQVTLLTAAVHTLGLGTIPPGLTVTGNNSNSITLVGPLAGVNAALNGLTFTPAANFNGPATIEISANDMGHFPPPAMTGSATLEINVVPVNDPPVNTVPGPQAFNEDTSLTFSVANGNAISVADIDITGNQPVRVTLTAADGTLTLNGTAGLAFTAGDGNADATMTFSGSIAAINAALDGLLYVPPPSFSGNTTIQIVTNDLGNIGIGGPLTDTDTIALTVLGRNDPPIVANLIPNVIVNEDAPPTVLNLANVFSDVDIPPDPPLVLTVQANTNPTLLTASLVGTTLTLTYALDQSGTAFITIRATDSFGLSVSTTFRVTVGPVQDPPRTGNDNYVYEINTALTVAAPGVLANDVDPDGDPLTAVLFDVPRHGQLMFNANGSFTYLPDTDFRGRDSFVYKSDDGNGNRVAATVVLNSFDSRWVERMYTEVLGRPGPTAVGDSEINFWVGQLNAGMTRLQIAELFVTSTERRRVIINQLYQTYLGRPADGPGLGFWLSVWDANRGPERVQAGIIASNEFFNTAGGTPQTWVQALYQNLLGRSAGPEEIAFWAPQAANPQTREGVVMGFVTSDEFRLNLIRGFYTTFLRRPIDTAGANFWLQQMRSGFPQETILAGILASSEYRLRA